MSPALLLLLVPAFVAGWKAHAWWEQRDNLPG